jgi:hypothetical protein
MYIVRVKKLRAFLQNLLHRRITEGYNRHITSLSPPVIIRSVSIEMPGLEYSTSLLNPELLLANEIAGVM